MNNQLDHYSTYTCSYSTPAKQATYTLSTTPIPIRHGFYSPTDLDFSACDSSLRLLCSLLEHTPTGQMVQQPVMDEVEATQCNPSQQTQATLDMIFEEEEEEEEDIHNSPPPTPRRLKYWKARLAIYARMKDHFETVHCESDFPSMFIRGRNSRSSISQETASLRQIYDEVYPELSAKEQRIFPTFQQYKNWSRNTRWIFSHSNPHRQKNMSNRKWLYHFLISYGFQ